MAFAAQETFIIIVENSFCCLTFCNNETIQAYVVRLKKREKLTFIHQGCNKLISCDSEDTYNVTKDLYLKE